MQKYKKGISIVICTFNGATKVPMALEALKKQIKLNNISWEVIVVDNASTDNTSDVVKSTWGSYEVPLKLIHEPKPGRNHALKTAFSNVGFEYVINVDDDNILCEDYLFKAFEIVEGNSSIGILGGKGIGKFSKPLPNWMLPFTYSLAIGAQAKKDGVHDKNYLYGAGIVYRKSYYDHLFHNGFEFFLAGRKGKKMLAGEDMEICMAMKLAGFQLYYSSDLTFEHVIDDSRIDIDHVKKLYRGFGASDLVLDQYKNKLGSIEGFKRKAINKGYLIYLLYNFYTLIKNFFRLLIKPDKSRTKLFYQIELIRSKSLVSFTIKNMSLFYQVRNTLNNADWIKDNQ